MKVHLFTKYSSIGVLDQIDIKTKGKTKPKEKAQVTFLTSNWVGSLQPTNIIKLPGVILDILV